VREIIQASLKQIFMEFIGMSKPWDKYFGYHLNRAQALFKLILTLQNKAYR